MAKHTNGDTYDMYKFTSKKPKTTVQGNLRVCRNSKGQHSASLGQTHV